VRTLIDEACALGMLDADSRAVVVEVSVPDSLPRVVVDRVQIQQVLINLVRNAVEAVEKAPVRRIEIGAAAASGRIEIAVADSGPGIAPEIRNRLFSAFTTSKPYGTGLGLSTSRSIAEAHGGRLTAEDRPGGGTLFRLVLPQEENAHG
jgi:two-component system sensor kinase FixL